MDVGNAYDGCFARQNIVLRLFGGGKSMDGSFVHPDRERKSLTRDSVYGKVF